MATAAVHGSTREGFDAEERGALRSAGGVAARVQGASSAQYVLSGNSNRNERAGPSQVPFQTHTESDHSESTTSASTKLRTRRVGQVGMLSTSNESWASIEHGNPTIKATAALIRVFIWRRAFRSIWVNKRSIGREVQDLRRPRRKGSAAPQQSTHTPSMSRPKGL